MSTFHSIILIWEEFFSLCKNNLSSSIGFIFSSFVWRTVQLPPEWELCGGNVQKGNHLQGDGHRVQRLGYKSWAHQLHGPHRGGAHFTGTKNICIFVLFTKSASIEPYFQHKPQQKVRFVAVVIEFKSPYLKIWCLSVDTVVSAGLVRGKPLQPRCALLLQHTRRGAKGAVCVGSLWLLAWMQPPLSR